MEFFNADVDIVNQKNRKKNINFGLWNLLNDITIKKYVFIKVRSKKKKDKI